MDLPLSEILRSTLKTHGELSDRNSKRLIHILQVCEGILLDDTERSIQRPLDEDRQSASYSGKKNHSIKNNLLGTSNLRIVWLSSTYEGYVHNKKICDEVPFYFPKVLGSGKIQVSSDTGRMELKYAYSRRNLKGKGLLLLKNKRTSGFTESGLKWTCHRWYEKMRIVKERFRCHKFGFEDMVILIACGLHNFRIRRKMSHITN